jgi:hypothetical protein
LQAIITSFCALRLSWAVLACHSLAFALAFALALSLA